MMEPSPGGQVAARSRGSQRALIVKVLALPVVIGVGVLGWQLPRAIHSVSAAPPAGPSGAAAVGSTDYKVPDGALVVSPSGSDSAAGSAGKPLRTVAKAIAKARTKDTIVVRGGVYHESVTVPAGKQLTIQSHPREAVWFDGSSPVEAWTPRGGAWVRDGWTARFDASPTYTAGAAASGDDDFQFVSPQHPMAAHPDQVWIDGRAQRQVGSRGEVKGGTFYVDEGARRLVMGADPRGHDVRASTLDEAITIRGAGTVLRGIGVRRYATALPQMGSVKVVAPNVTVENIAVTDSATTGLSVLAGSARVQQVTTTGSGMLGVHANYADDLRLKGVRSTHNNVEHFKYSPVSGGIKVTRSRGVTVTGSLTADNFGKGLWLDESVYDITLTGNRVARNADHGIALELSAKAVVAGNVVRDNGGTGLKVNNTSDVQIWNNTFARNARGVHLVQDKRRPGVPGTPGRDPRQKQPDPEMTWLTGKITMSNNAFDGPATGVGSVDCLLCVEDHSHQRSGAQMGLTLNGNLYVRPGSVSPRGLVLWPKDGGASGTFPDLGDFRSATGQEAQGRTHRTEHGTGPDGALKPALRSEADGSAAQPLPGAIAGLLDRPAGTRHMGAWISES
ncbi:right-handed parallel beta-helix repeat-containing protein [Actinomadura xylanilytica]|uniref:right-handed parallel beta-helix repeat-containing protein n=1 Tax=Actinomadura xylanilytica TaxID=887459 RepID=UPI00255AC278|nr:right-handed parallel beta-helix repeat-containing protein [Actinomadura xylanilytica]MDL4772337.1 right-handed parallel beta-helix repeat-containing protein [Actinomadura xylanilytica]